MTANQIAYQKNLIEEENNRTRNAETERNNRVHEGNVYQEQVLQAIFGATHAVSELGRGASSIGSLLAG